MKIMIDWVYLLAAAVGCVGVMEYVKGLFPGAPKWVWRGLLPVAAIAVAAFGGGGLAQAGTNALLVLALAQVAYEAIVASIKTKVGG